MTSASLLIATTIERSPGFSSRRNACEACFASCSRSPAMLKLRSTPRATVSGNSPATNVVTSCGTPSSSDFEVRLAQTGHRSALRIGDGGVHLDELDTR